MRPFIYLAVLFLGVSSADAGEIRYTGGAYRDPFAAQIQDNTTDEAFKTEQRIKALTVQGMLLSTKSPRAIIGGKIYHVGSSLESGKVTRIDKDGVAVTLNGKEIIIEQKIRKAKYESPQSKV